MDIRISNVREYIFYLMGICGELPVKNIPRALPYSKNYVLNEFKKIKDEGLIREFRYPDKRRFYRLTHPKGTNALMDFSPALLTHFEMMSGKPGARYNGDKERRLKARNLSELLLYLQKLSIVDGINPEVDSNIFGVKDDTGLGNKGVEVAEDLDIILREINKNTAFITSKLKRKSEKEKTVYSRQDLYRSLGTLINGKTILSVYLLLSPREIWNRDAERQISGQIYRQCLQLVPSLRNISDTPKMGLFFLPDGEAATEFVLRESKNIKIKPEQVYDLSHVFPLSQEGFTALEMMLIPDWKKKVNNILLSELAPENSLEDGIMEDGNAAYNMLCFSVEHMRFCSDKINYSHGTVITHEWAKGMYEKLMPNAKVITLSEEELRVLLTAVKSV